MSHVTQSRRQVLTGIGISCAAAALVACSGTGDGGETAAPTTVTATASDPAAPGSDHDTAGNTEPDITDDDNTDARGQETPTATSESRLPAETACHSHALTVSVVGEQGAAGSVIYSLGFTNDSGQACDLQGFPGVSLVGHEDGTQIGAAAIREDDGSTRQVVVEPGRTVTADVRASRAENYDPAECGELVPADGFRVYPPGNTAAEFVPLEGISGCSSDAVELLSVKPITA